MGYTETPNMRLLIPGVGTEPGPLYATDINTSLNKIDAHDHGAAGGVAVNASTLSWTGEVNINSQTISNIGSLNLYNNLYSFSSSFKNYLYVLNKNLYFNDGDGNAIPLTASGSPTNEYSKGVEVSAAVGYDYATFLSSVFVLYNPSLSNVRNQIDLKSIILRGTNTTWGLTLAPPTLSTDYTLTLPPSSSLPVDASLKVVNVNQYGVMNAYTLNQVGQFMGQPGADGIAAVMSSTGTSSIVSTMIAANADTILSKMSYTPSHRNRIINGSMAIDQRNSGATQTFTAAAALAYSVDRWYGYCTGANVTGARVAGSGNTAYRYQFTGAASVTAIGFGQRIESINAAYLTSQTATLSVDLANSVLTTVTWTAYYANTADTFGTRTQIATGTFTVNSAVTRYSTQISMPSQAANGVEIVFTVGAQTSGTWTIGNVQLEAGSVATPFEARLGNETLMLCQRYCQVLNSVNDSAIGYSNTTSILRATFHLKQTMRTAPNATISGTIGTASSAFATDFRAATTITAVSFVNASPNTATFSITTSTLYASTGVGDRFYITGNGNGSIVLAAEL